MLTTVYVHTDAFVSSYPKTTWSMLGTDLPMAIHPWGKVSIYLTPY